MRKTIIKKYINSKNEEHKELQSLYLQASLSGESIVYQKFNYTSNGLLGKIKKVEAQLQGSMNVIENIGERKWNNLNLSFIENIAKEEFNFHLAIDSKYYKIICEKLIEKVVKSLLNGDDISINVKRLSNLKDKLIFNLKRYSDIDYKKDWIRDRYFEIASFIVFDSSMDVEVKGSETDNSIFDIVIFGEKTIEDMKKAGIFYDVIVEDFAKIMDLSKKEIFCEVNL